jgi:hypothetical protein
LFALCNTVISLKTNRNVQAQRKHFQIGVTRAMYWLEWNLCGQTPYKKWYLCFCCPMLFWDCSWVWELRQKPLSSHGQIREQTYQNWVIV